MKRSLTDLIRKKEPGRQGFADSILSRVTSKAWENDADIEDPGAAERSGKVRACTLTQLKVVHWTNGASLTC